MDFVKDIGKGTIVKRDGRVFYTGSLPFKEDDKVMIFREEDVQAMLGVEASVLLASHIPMPDDLYRPESQKALPDEITIQVGGIPKSNLFLDRRLYSLNPRDYLFVRWTSVDLALAEDR